MPHKALGPFLEQYWRDRKAGEIRPLVQYLTLFPNEADVIATRYITLQRVAEVVGTEDARLEMILATCLDRAHEHADTVVTELCEDPEQADVVRKHLKRLKTLGIVGALGPTSAAPEQRPRSPGDTAEWPYAPDQFRRVGPYRTIRELGSGGQGIVFLAEDTRVGRRVALKILTAVGRSPQETIRRFRREAEVAARLNHPGICAVFDVGLERNHPFIVMPFLEGETLAGRLARDRQEFDHAAMRAAEENATIASFSRSIGKDAAGIVDVPEVLRLIEETALALHAAHEAGVIHRDIKPGNVMVTPEGRPVLLDFGLARSVEQDLSSLTATGALLGTLPYMSPEQIRSGKHLDGRTDVYSLGVTLFECLTLRTPFRAPTQEGLFHAILSEDAPDPTLFNSDISRDLKVVIETAVDKDLDRRYRSALAFAEDLRRVLDEEPVQARPAWTAVQVRRRRMPTATVASHPPVLTYSLVVTSCLLALFVVFFYSKWRNAKGDWELERDKSTRIEETQNALLDEGRRLGHQMDEATEERRALSERLSQWEGLADLARAKDLSIRSEALWPVHQRDIPRMTEWISEARVLAARLKDHAESLSNIRRNARTHSPEERRIERNDHPLAERLREIDQELAGIRRDRDVIHVSSAAASPVLVELDEEIGELEAHRTALDRELSSFRTWRFTSPTDTWRHDVTAELVELLTHFQDPRAGIVQSMERRLAAARLLARAEEPHRETWNTCLFALKAIGLGPQFTRAHFGGLVPLGIDPESKLWEFGDVLSGKLPTRDAKGGLLQREPDGGLVFVFVPPLHATLGAQAAQKSQPLFDRQAHSDEAPVHGLDLSWYLISKFEMTEGQWWRLSQMLPSTSRIVRAAPKNPALPVCKVSWTEAERVLGRFAMGLPTEAQWECAARAGTKSPWFTGDVFEALEGWVNLADSFALEHGAQKDWVFERLIHDGYLLRAPVGSFRQNPFGLHDMLGNVREWCLDAAGPYTRPPRRGDGLRFSWASDSRCVRGGSYRDAAGRVRVSDRDRAPSNERAADLGFRPVRRVRQ